MSVGVWITLFFAFSMVNSAQGAKSSVSPELDCGIYRLRGQLKEKGNGVEVLELNPGTTARADVVLHELSVDDAVGYQGKNVEIEVYVYRPGKGPEARARVLKPAQAATLKSVTHEPVTILSKKACE